MKKRWLALIVLVGLLLAIPASATVVPEVWTEHTIEDNFAAARYVYATDVDGDGDVDVVGAAAGANDIAWWENDGSGNFTGRNIDPLFYGAWSVYATDVDGDTHVDVLGAAYTDDEITWWENDGTPGDGGWVAHVITDTFDGVNSVYATDVDGDTDVDILGAAMVASDITWWENDGSQNFTAHTIEGDFAGATLVYATDVDGDGDVDVLGAAYSAGDIIWWENEPSGNPPPADPISWTPHTIRDDFTWAECVYTADVDSDGDVDILGASSGLNDITWWENMTQRVFLPLVLKNYGP